MQISVDIENILMSKIVCLILPITSLPIYFYILYKLILYNYTAKLCIVIRIYKPTYSQLKRYNRWKSTLPNYYTFYLLSMEKINLSVYNNSMKNMVVSFDDVKRVYPSIFKIKGNCSTFKSPKLLSWISHTESLTIFYNNIKIKYKYVWIIEQDVGYTGMLYDFLKKYELNNKDFITLTINKITPNWVWYYCSTNKYIKRRKKFFKNNYGYSNREYVQRWSITYFIKISYDLKNYYHSQSETSSIETVFYHNLSYEIVSKNYIGSPLSAAKSLTNEQWISISKKKEKRNKFYHPLKF